MQKDRLVRLTKLATMLLLIFALLLAGCGAKKFSSENITMDAVAPAERKSMESGSVPPTTTTMDKDKALSFTSGNAGYGLEVYGLEKEIARKIIRHAVIEQKVKDLDEAVEKVMQLVADSRGYLQSSSIREYSERERIANYVLRIPEGSYDTVLMQLRQIGKNVNMSESGNDVSEEYYDNEARIKNLKLQEEAVQKLFDRADKMEDILAIQKELFAIRGNIESLQGRNRYLDNLTSLSTIELTIREVKPVEYLKEEDESAISRAKEGFIDTLAGLTRFVVEMFVFLVSALPVLIIFVGILAFVLWFLLKKRRNKDRNPDNSNGTNL